MENTLNVEPNGDNLLRCNPTTIEVSVEVEPNISAAERMYSKHLCNVKKYQRNNPEKMKEKSKRYMGKLKEDKTRYGEYLEKRRIYYNAVLKPNKENKLVEAHETLPTTLVI